MSVLKQLGLEHVGHQVELPSNGVFGGPKTVMVRPFILKDEKQMLQIDPSSILPSLRQLAKNVVIDTELDLAKITDDDVTIILTAAKCITYGDAVEVMVMCTSNECFMQESTFKQNLLLSTLKYNKLEKNMFPRKIKLPSSGITLEYSVLTCSRYNEAMAQETKTEIAKADVKDKIDYILAAMIDRVFDSAGSEVQVTQEDKLEIVRAITKVDLNAWTDDKSLVDASTAFDFKAECPKCKSKQAQRLVITPDFFFRPTPLLISSSIDN